jgi:tetratricopeptide (TPR) repeat protein
LPPLFVACLPGLLASLLMVVLSGCAIRTTQGLPPGMQGIDVPPEFEGRIARMSQEGERNWVLNLQELAVEALAGGERELAKRALDEAILLIEVIYGDSEQARRARTAFYKEESKIFKGDPYERTMTYFYRGVLYMQDRVWDNARACFRSASLMDSFAEDEQHRADWALIEYLTAICELRLGYAHTAREVFDRARTLYADFAQRYDSLSPPIDGSRRSSLLLYRELPEFDERDNLLILTQHGIAPRKVGVGRYGQFVGVEPGGGSDGAARVRIAGRDPVYSRLIDSVYYQAVTRGGRELDRIQGNQAIVRGATEDTGVAAAHVGVWAVQTGMATNNRDVAVGGAVLALAGLLAYGASTTIQPQADLRTWSNLPDALGMVRTRVPAEPLVVEVLYPGRGGGSEGRSAHVRLHPREQDLCVLLVFEHPVPFILAPPDLLLAETAPVGAELN